MFERELTIRLGSLEVRMMHLGNGHTRGDSVVWIPSQGICFAGDLVEFNAGVYTGDAYLADWPATLDRFGGAAPRRWCRAEAGADHAAGLPRSHRLHAPLGADAVLAAREGVASGKSLRTVYADTRRVMDPNSAMSSSTNTRFPSTSRAPTTKPAASSTRASGPPSATATCGPS